MKGLLSRLILRAVLFAAVSATAATRYVNLNNLTPSAPYTSWSDAATNIQDAVDAASAGDSILVTNGVYQIGSRVSPEGVTNRVVVTNAITLQSVNGRTVTWIDGGHAMRCVYLGDGAVLSGFTITNGYTASEGGGIRGNSTNALVMNSLIISNWSSYGGGVMKATVSNCVVSCNRSTGSGGGAEWCVVNNSILSSNYAGLFGGGASGGISYLNNCLVVGNSSADSGDAVFGSVLNNCLVLSNGHPNTFSRSAVAGCMLNNCTVIGNRWGVDTINRGIPTGANNSIIYFNSGPDSWSVLPTNCCTTGFTSGVGNITNAPLFVNLAAGDFRLQSNSPCINAGKNSLVSTSVDLDGDLRIVGETVDMGAYEYPSPTSLLSYAWAQRYGLATDGSADFTDADGDDMRNYGEWRSDTNPTNSLSVLRLLNVIKGPAGASVTWQSVGTRSYWVERASNLTNAIAFQIVATNITGSAGSKTFTDAAATNSAFYFYRVGAY